MYDRKSLLDALDELKKLLGRFSEAAPDDSVYLYLAHVRGHIEKQLEPFAIRRVIPTNAMPHGSCDWEVVPR